MYADSSDRVPSDRNLPSTLEDEDETGTGDADSIAEHVIDKAWAILVQCMDPNPIFDCALKSDIFKFYQIRDMKDKEDTSEKNRRLCDNIRRQGRIGYDKLKDWLVQTDQQDLVEVLDCIEDGKDYTKSLDTLHEKIKNRMLKGNQKDEAYGEMKSELQGAGRRWESGIIRSISQFFGFGQKTTQKGIMAKIKMTSGIGPCRTPCKALRKQANMASPVQTKATKITLKYKRGFRKSPGKIERIKLAIGEVVNGMSVRKAAKKCNLSESFLRRRIAGDVSLESRNGPKSVFNAKEEEEMAKWLSEMSRRGMGLGVAEFLDFVTAVLKKDKRKNNFKNDRPSYTWYYSFMARNAHIVEVRKESPLESSRAKVTSADLDNWFSKYYMFVSQLHLLDKPNRIYNADESGFSMGSKPGSVIGPTKKNFPGNLPHLSGNSKKRLTAMFCGNAEGDVIPPFLVYPSPQPTAYDPSINSRKGTVIDYTEKGWMNAKTFFKFLKHFDQYACQDRPVSLLIDSVSSHIDLDVFTFAKEKGIELYRLIPNATHFLQPLDNGVFGPLKKAWYQIVRKNTKENPDKSIGKENFAAKLHEAFLNFYKPLTVVNSFKSTGIFPIDRSKISESRLKPAMTFHTVSAEKEHIQADCNNNSEPSHEVSPMSAVSVTPENMSLLTDTSPAQPVSVLPGTSYVNVTPHPVSVLPGTSYANITPNPVSPENLSLLPDTSPAQPVSVLPGTSYVNVTSHPVSVFPGTNYVDITSNPVSPANMSLLLDNSPAHPVSFLPGTSYVNVTHHPVSKDVSSTSLFNAIGLQSPLSLLADVAYNLSHSKSVSQSMSDVNTASSNVSTYITDATTKISECSSGVNNTVSPSVIEALVFPSCRNVKKRASNSDTLPDCLTSAESIRTSALKQLNSVRQFARKELAAKKRYMKENLTAQVKEKNSKKTAVAKGKSAACSRGKKKGVSRVKAKKALSFNAGSKSDHCSVCKKLTEDPDGWVQCDICDSWIHVSCIPKDHDFDHAALTSETVEFFCHFCVT